MAQQAGELDRVASIVRTDQHSATLPRTTGALMNYKKSAEKPSDHAIGRSRGGLMTKSHLVCDGKGRVLAFVATGGQVADTSILATTLEQISVAGARGRPRTRPQRLIADKGYPLEGEPGPATPGWHRGHDPRAGRSDRAPPQTPGSADRPREDQRQHYRGRNVVERCFNRLKQRRGIAMCSDRYARTYHARLSPATTLHSLATVL